jgi:putative tricarboxylic transport membrane protein
MRRSPAEIALSAGVLALGATTAVGTALLPSEGGYARIGPNFMPAVVAAGLLLLGAWLLWEASTGQGWRRMPSDAAEARGEHPFHAGAFVWVSAGLFAQMLLIHTAGFVLAGAALFLCVARGFGSARVARDAALGLAITLAIYLFFAQVLTVSLPAGWLAPLLRVFGIP